MKKIATLIVGTAAAVILSASPASAQPNAIAGGFSCQKWNSGFCGLPDTLFDLTAGPGSKGFSVDFRHDIHTAPTTATSIVVDFGWNRFTDAENDSSIVAGVRETFMTEKRVSLFVQGTAGVMLWKETFPGGFNDQDILIGGGGGLIVNLTDRIGVAGALDLWGDYDTFEQDWDPIVRLTVKLVYKLGAKK